MTEPRPDTATETDPGPLPALFLGLLLGVTFYVAADILGLPKPRYLPVTGEWTFSPRPGAVGMGYYGLLLWGFLGYGTGYGLGRLAPLRTRLARPAPLRLLGRTTLFAVLAALGYFLLHELHRWS